MHKLRCFNALLFASNSGQVGRHGEGYLGLDGECSQFQDARCFRTGALHSSASVNNTVNMSYTGYVMHSSHSEHSTGMISVITC